VSSCFFGKDGLVFGLGNAGCVGRCRVGVGVGVRSIMGVVW
jgi:hypothetical protein